MARWGDPNETSTIKGVNVNGIASTQELNGRMMNDRSMQRQADIVVGVPSTTNKYSVVGINAAKVQPAVDAIESYIKNIENKISEIKESADMNQFVKSDVIQTSVKNYIARVEEYCTNLTSNMRAFKDELVRAQQAWEAFAQGLSYSIEQDTNSTNVGTYKAS